MNNPFDKESWTEQERETINAGGWQCSFCGTINAAYVTSCVCGHNQDDSYENLHGRYVPRADEEYTEQQSIGETASVGAEVESPFEEIPSAPAEAEAEPAFEEIPSTSAGAEAETPAELSFEEIPSVPAEAEAESPFEEIPSAPAEPSFEEVPAFEEIPSVSAVSETEPSFEEIPSAQAAEEAVVEETSLENTAAPIPEPAPAAPPVKKPVSKTNRPIEEYTELEQGILNDGGWECAFCERINASYITSCACGHSEDDSFLKRRGKYVNPDTGELEPAVTAPEAAPATAAVAATDTAAPVTPAPAAPASTPAAPAAELTPADMIAEIEQELAADSSEMAKFRAIRKYKNLVKKGYMTKEEFNKKQDELLSFEDDDAMAAPESSGEDNA